MVRTADRAAAERRDCQTARLPDGAAANGRTIQRRGQRRIEPRAREFGAATRLFFAVLVVGTCAFWQVRRLAVAPFGSRVVRQSRVHPLASSLGSRVHPLASSSNTSSNLSHF